MKNATRGVERIRKVILQDKTGAPEQVLSVLKSDLFELLDGYFEVNPQSVSLEVAVDEHGFYTIAVTAKAFRVRAVGRGE